MKQLVFRKFYAKLRLMLKLYPSIKPYQTEYLSVDAEHEIYLEESGNPKGVPVLVLHGGPGAGSNPNQRRWFDPNHYRIILFDQRGAGKSKPQGELFENTTQHLIDDIEKIRKHLNIESWILFGGSWGAALALLYAQAHPKQVKHMILRGILLANRSNRDWFFKCGANKVFPDYWRDFVKDIPANEQDDLITAYYNRLTSDNEIMRMAAAKSWSLWHRRCASFEPLSEEEDNTHTTLRCARIESHFFYHDCFINEDQILDNMSLIREIPTIIIHGRYDMICPLSNAFQIHKALPNSRLEIVRNAGHMSSEPGIVNALIKATNEIANNTTVS